MPNTLFTPTRLRTALNQPWLIAIFGVSYLISQATIICIVQPLADDFMWLQLTAFDAATYHEVFTKWQQQGHMDAYRAHLVFDHTHWILYAGFATTVMCALYEKLNVNARWNWLLILPLVSGLCDWYENHMQEVFLQAADFRNIVDPLPFWSTIASITKWSLAAIYVGVIDGMLIRWGLRVFYAKK
jgi:hypothetical protein